MTSCPEEMGWEFGRFWKKDRLVFRPWCGEVGVRPWGWEVGSWLGTMQADNWASVIGGDNGVLGHKVKFRPWCWEAKVRPWSWEFEIGPRDVPNMGGIVNIVWLRKTFNNCVSLPTSKNRSQKLIKRSYLNNTVHLHLYIYCCYWYYGCEYTTHCPLIFNSW